MGVVRRQWRRWHREGGDGGTGGWRQWHVEGGRMAWAARQCGQAARWGCEVRTMGVAVAHGCGPWVHWVCHHVSVRVGVARVQLGCAGERTLCGAWAKPEVGCRVYQRGLGCIGEGRGCIGEGCGYTMWWPFHGRQFNSADYTRCAQHDGTRLHNGRGGSVAVEQWQW